MMTRTWGAFPAAVGEEVLVPSQGEFGHLPQRISVALKQVPGLVGSRLGQRVDRRPDGRVAGGVQLAAYPAALAVGFG
jgi:hypothetical protein